jgi:hypothetical protein
VPRTGQLFAPQSPVAHVTSHVHALLHVMLPHELVVSHATLQLPVLLLPHVIVPQAPAASHVIVQSSEPHEIVPHAPVDPHVMSHFMPLGQVRLVPEPSIVQVGGDVDMSHDVHVEGHEPGFTQ